MGKVEQETLEDRAAKAKARVLLLKEASPIPSLQFVQLPPEHCDLEGPLPSCAHTCAGRGTM